MTFFQILVLAETFRKVSWSLIILIKIDYIVWVKYLWFRASCFIVVK